MKMKRFLVLGIICTVFILYFLGGLITIGPFEPVDPASIRYIDIVAERIVDKRDEGGLFADLIVFWEKNSFVSATPEILDSKAEKYEIHPGDTVTIGIYAEDLEEYEKHLQSGGDDFEEVFWTLPIVLSSGGVEFVSIESYNACLRSLYHRNWVFVIGGFAFNTIGATVFYILYFRKRKIFAKK